jgi:hypothetical protein
MPAPGGTAGVVVSPVTAKPKWRHPFLVSFAVAIVVFGTVIALLAAVAGLPR